MPHVRTQIRDAVAALLATTATAGDNVLVGRTRPLGVEHPPTLMVYSTPAVSGGQENASVMGLSTPRRLSRVMMLSVVGHVQEATPCDDTLDQLAAEVEEALGGDIKLGGLVKDFVLASTVSQVDAVGDRHVGAIRLVFSVTYHTKENAPQTAV